MHPPFIERDLPRERMICLGPGALTDAELLAILLGTGLPRMDAIELARCILVDNGGLQGIAQKTVVEITHIPGIGRAKGARIAAAVELGIRLGQRGTRLIKERRFVCSSDVYETYQARLGLHRVEVFLVIGLNAKNSLVCEFQVASGTPDQCHVDPSNVFRRLIAEASSRAILVHNHPSGDSTPSPDDIALTKRLTRAGKLLGIDIIDHIIIGIGAYSSLRDLGLLTLE